VMQFDKSVETVHAIEQLDMSSVSTRSCQDETPLRLKRLETTQLSPSMILSKARASKNPAFTEQSRGTPKVKKCCDSVVV
jgi:hypothetical protein